MKKVFLFLTAAVFSLVIGLVIPYYINDNVVIENTDNISILDQKIEGYSDVNVLNYKIYDDGKLIGILKNKDQLFQNIKNYKFDNSDGEYDINNIGLKENIYVVEELSKIVYEDIDSNILDYLSQNKYIGIKSTCVKFSNNKGIYDIIYISNENDFISARDKFILNFISQDSLNKIERGEKVDSPLSYGRVDTGIAIVEKMEISTGIALPDEIFKSENEIYEYLCYGRNTERQYYTTGAGDTLAFVGRSFNGMTAKQVMMINSDIIKDENQILEEGTVLNVAYYTPPISIIVTKQRLAPEIMYPDEIKYEPDAEMEMGQILVVQEEENGLDNVLLEEHWINGKLVDDDEASLSTYKSLASVELSRYTVSKPKQGIVKVGKGTNITSHSAGSGNWRWPVTDPLITCDYFCYAGHGGVDFYNLYNPWGYVLAIDSGVVVDTGWTNLGGYYARIDHNNGYVTYYGHFSTAPTVQVGQSVSAGDILGPIGMTGNATGPHVHLAMYENGILINPCTVLNCSLLY